MGRAKGQVVAPLGRLLRAPRMLPAIPAGPLSRVLLVRPVAVGVLHLRGRHPVGNGGRHDNISALEIGRTRGRMSG
jgi:hypothetical protein